MKYFIFTRSVGLFRIAIAVLFILSLGVISPVHADPSFDVAVSNVFLSPSSPLPGEPFVVNLTITNLAPNGTPGDGNSIRPDVFIDVDPHASTNAFGCPTEEYTYTRSDGNWTYDGGQVRTGADTAISIPGDALGVGHHNIWVFIDGACGSITETVAEKANNFYGPISVNIESGVDTTGVFRPSNGLLYLKYTNTSGFADVAINYGTPGDYPVTGDWDGNGTATIGIYRNGSFYLRNSNTLGFADLVFAFGTPGDQPIAGDWDNDGTDTIGIFRTTTGQFQLRNSNSAGSPDMSFNLGNAGDVGIAGDWNGDGLDTTGVFRPSNGVLFMKNTNTSGFADIAINYGIPGDRPVTGDWDADGIDTIGVYRNGQFLLRNSNTLGFADLVFALGIPGDMPIAGNWTGLP